MEREYCVDFEPYDNQALNTLITKYGRRTEVQKGTYFIKPGDLLCEIS